MMTFLLIIHLFVTIGLVGLVLLQRSEGGGLGIGGGGGGGFMTTRGTANALTRATMGFATAFFITSITLSFLAGAQRTGPAGTGSVTDAIPASSPAPGSRTDEPIALPGDEGTGASGSESPAAGSEGSSSDSGDEGLPEVPVGD
jgi:preprotein translocase subunit SecG